MEKIKRDIKVDIMRIIACFTVIMYHTRTLPLLEDGSVSETAVFIECICSICVVTFFLISGFFIYNKNGNIFSDWWHVIVSFIKTLCGPALLVAIFCIIFNDYLFSKSSFVECIQKVNINDLIWTLIEGIKSISVNKWPGSTAHLWYVFSYAMIIFYYPIVRCFLKLDKKIVYTVLIILALLQLYDDILVYYDKWSFNVFFDKVQRPVIYSAWGHMFYNDMMVGVRKKISKKKQEEVNIKNVNEIKNKNIQKNFITNIFDKIILNKKIFIISIVMYVISFAGLYFMQYMYNMYVRGIHAYTSWYSIGSLTLSMAVEMFIMNIDFDYILNEKHKKIIFYIGGMTLGIYLLHYIVLLKLNSILFQHTIQHFLSKNLFTQMIYLVFYNLFLFILTGMCVLVVRGIYNVIRKPLISLL